MKNVLKEDKQNELRVTELLFEVLDVDLEPVPYEWCPFDLWNTGERVAVEFKARISYKSTDFPTVYLSVQKLDELYKLRGTGVDAYFVVAWSDATGVLKITRDTYKRKAFNRRRKNRDREDVVYMIPVVEFDMYRALKLKESSNHGQKEKR